jgi:hypothetical protein
MNVTRNEKIISVKTYLGQVSKSIDKVKKSIANDITNGRTFKSNRLLENNIKEKKTKIRLKIIKVFCHSVTNNNFDNAIKRTGKV